MAYFNLDSLNELGNQNLKKQKLFFVIFGILSMLAGILCFINPVLSSVTLSIIVGSIFIINGIIYLMIRLSFTRFHSFWSILLGILLGILYIYLGYQFIKNPELGIMAIAYLIGIGFLIVGILRLIIGFSGKGYPGRGLIIFTGIIEVLISISLISSWPANSVLLVSVFLGIEFIFNSLDAFMISSYIKRLMKNNN